MHEQLTSMLLWQALGMRNHERLYRGGMLRRASRTERIAGRVIAAVGRRLAALGDYLQGDEIAVSPRSPQWTEQTG